MASDRDPRPSEFGGVPGLIQPPPHDPKDDAAEQAYLLRQSNPADSSDNASGVQTQRVS